jgi:colicin import membrane protein
LGKSQKPGQLDKDKAQKDYPGQYETATSKHESAKHAFSAEDYRTSLSEAEAAKAALDELENMLAKASTDTATTDTTTTDTTTTDTTTTDTTTTEKLILPKYYVVRLIVLNRDCFWKIAGYSFVYNNPRQWRLLYEKNKHLLHQPNNPDLIHPKMVFEIPQLADEIREGTYDPEKDYPVMPKGK